VINPDKTGKAPSAATCGDSLRESRDRVSQSGVSWLINSPAVLEANSEQWVGLTPQQAREIADALHTAGRFLRAFDGLAQDENDGTYALWRDADLFMAANALREALRYG
jgi:hypothetical protein